MHWSSEHATLGMACEQKTHDTFSAHTENQLTMNKAYAAQYSTNQAVLSLSPDMV